MASPLTAMIQAKSTQSMSFAMSLAMTFNGLSWAIYGAIIAYCNPFICVPNGIGCVAGCVQLMLFWTYPKQRYFKLEQQDIGSTEAATNLSDVGLRQRAV